jgi:hypothetical protein
MQLQYARSAIYIHFSDGFELVPSHNQLQNTLLPQLFPVGYSIVRLLPFLFTKRIPWALFLRILSQSVRSK